MALIEANLGGGWFDLPTPKPNGYFPSYTHLENSFRDARGYLHRDIIRYNTAKLECSWNALNNEEINLLQSLYSYNKIWLRYTDNFGNRVEKQMYASPLKNQVNSIDHTTLKSAINTNVTMDFIEY